MPSNARPEREQDHAAEDSSSTAGGVLAYVLVLAGMLGVALGIWHRHEIDLRWDHLERTSPPPLEAYETLPLDLDAAFVLLAVNGAWLVLQLTAVMFFLAKLRRAGILTWASFWLLWFVSLLALLELNYSIWSVYRLPSPADRKAKIHLPRCQFSLRVGPGRVPRHR